jgi:hypothetical protein
MMKKVLLLLLIAAPLCAQDPAPTGFYLIRQCRWFDTRLNECVPGSKPIGLPCPVGALYDGETRMQQVQTSPICRDNGSRPVPLGAKALAFTVTAVEATGDGHLLFFPGSYELRPETVTLTFQASKARSNFAIVPLGQLQLQEPGIPFVPDVWVYVRVPGGGTVHLVADLVGYFQ